MVSPFVQRFFDAELLAAAVTERRFGIDLALHDIELAIDRRQPAFGLDQNGSHTCRLRCDDPARFAAAPRLDKPLVPQRLLVHLGAQWGISADENARGGT